MAEAVKIANLQIEISDNSQTATKSLGEFVEMLKSVRESASGNLGLSNVAKGLREIKETGTGGIESLATSLAAAIKPAEQLASALSRVAEANKSISGNKSLSSAVNTTGQLQSQFNTANKANSRAGLVDDTAAFTAMKQQAADLQTTVNQVNFKGKFAECAAEAEKAAQSTHKISDALKSVGRFGSSVLNNILPAGISNLISQFARLAKLKVLRSIISSLMQGFSQGLQNVYYWAKATGNGFAASMDTITTSMNYAKNSIGAAFSTVLSAVAPVIDKLIDILVQGINYVNMFFAVLSGASTYTKAKKVAVEYGTAASNAIGGAASAAQDLKEQLSVLDFDELHQLQEQSTSSGGGGGGGGGGGTGTSYGDMFETAAIEQNWLTKTAEWLKDNFDTILDIVKAIGAGILAWKIADAFSNTIKELTGLQKLGAAMLAIGIVLSYEGGYELGKNGFTVKGLVESLVGTGLSAIGGALMWGPTGAVIGVAVSVIANIIGYIKGDREAFEEKWLDFLKDKSITYNVALEGIEDANQRLEQAQALLQSIKSHSIEADETLQKISIGQSLLDQIKEFEGSISLSATDVNKLNGLVSAYNQLDLTDAVQWWEDVNGAVQTNVAEIQNAIDKYKEYATIAAYQNLITQTTTEQAQAKATMDQTAPLMQSASSQLDLKYEQLQNYIAQNYSGNRAITSWQPGDNALGKAALFKDPELFTMMSEINTLYEETSKYQDVYNTASEAYDEAGKQIDYFAGELAKASGSTEEYSNTVSNAAKNFPTNWSYSAPAALSAGIQTGQSYLNQTPTIDTMGYLRNSLGSLGGGSNTTNTTTNATVNSTTYTSDTSGITSAAMALQSYTGYVDSAYSAEQRQQAIQLAMNKGYYDVAAQIQNGGLQAQIYTDAILNSYSAMKNNATIVSDATDRTKKYTSNIQTAGTASQTSASQVNSISTALSNVGKNVSYSSIASSIKSNFSAQNWSAIGTAMKQNIETSLSTIGRTFNYAGVSNTIKTGFSNAVTASQFQTVGAAIGNAVSGSSGVGSLPNRINYSGLMNTVRNSFVTAEAQTDMSLSGRNAASDIAGSNGTSSLPNRINYSGLMNTLRSNFVTAESKTDMSLSGRNAASDIAGSNGAASLPNRISYSSLMNSVRQGFINAEYATDMSYSGRSIAGDIAGSNGAASLPGRIAYYDIMGSIKSAMDAAAYNTVFSSAGASIANSVKAGIASTLSSTLMLKVGSSLSSAAVSAYFAADGGILDSGTLFVAGEAGAEAVGTIGGKTGVANRDQIASAIAMALKPMLEKGGGNGTSTTNVNVKLDSATIAKASMKGQQAMNRQFNITASA